MNESKKYFLLSLLNEAIRRWFLENNFLEIIAPPMVDHPGMEPHIHPLKVVSTYQNNSILNEDIKGYLHTSPEFFLKKIISHSSEINEFKKIYSLGFCYRDEPNSPIHRNQFLMLEWYRVNDRYEKIREDFKNLILYCLEYLKKSSVKVREIGEYSFERKTVRELFDEYLGIDILDLNEKTKLKNYLLENHSDIPLPKDSEKISWDDYFFLLWLNEIEPKLVNRDFVIVDEYPAQLSALSTLSQNDQRVCERFEIYFRGIEICNAYNELVDVKEQIKREEKFRKEKFDLYGYELPVPTDLFQSLKRGIPSPTSGIALGVERLLTCLIEIDNPFTLH